MANSEPNNYRELTPEEQKLMRRLYLEHTISPCVRFGPKGYTFIKNHLKFAEDILNMQLKQGDVFVVTYQRSGTTWTQELVWLAANDFDYKKAAAVSLLDRYVFLELASLFDESKQKYSIDLSNNKERMTKNLEELTTPPTKILSNMPSPRFVKTHLPMTMLPPHILDTAKVVYVARDPRDVIVSCFHHARLFKVLGFKGTFRDLWHAFKNDLYVLTPYFEHVKEAWELRNHPNMLFLFYEDLLKDLPAAIRRVCEFLGKRVTPEQMERLCDHLSFRNFKDNVSVNYEESRELGLLESGETFIRKGESGGWREYFVEDMEQEVSRWIADNLAGTDLRFPTI